ncbi:putative ATP-grasp-modified RiPP [Hamadaea tsunoensis]|uniref:putative ATP-grasp-modified RiPP n=1 Tax=Hamadaea tsunoensis TaxID=53368 RepID=UPI0004152268|nr:putative ATP-grasp-modified RiPP [Hamadaea tsunoensis]
MPTAADVPYGVRAAQAVTPEPVNVAGMIYDPTQQINLVRDGEVMVPVLKHTSGTTATNTASQDNSGGADRDQDQRED